jgi:hypothetical protein
MLRALVYFVGEKKVVAKIKKQCAPYIVRWGWMGTRGLYGCRYKRMEFGPHQRLSMMIIMIS